MPVHVPEIDRRTYQEILNEAMARIAVHNPEWNNRNDSDPGITLLQLFSFIAESLLYRSRLIPERNRLKFLSLLGIPLEPASAARGVVAFENLKGPLRPVLLNRNLEVLAGKIPFRTANGLAALPVEGRVYRKAPLPSDREQQLKEEFEDLFQSVKTPEAELVLYETKSVEFGPTSTGAVDFASDTVDGTLWLALLARTKEVVSASREELGGQILTVGVVPEFGEEGTVLPPGSPPRQSGASLVFEFPKTDQPLPPNAVDRVARYRTVQSAFSNDVLAEPGTVQISLPGAAELQLWRDLDPNEAGVGEFPPALEGGDGDRVVTWIRIRPVRRVDEPGAGSLTTRLRWLGINAALVNQRAHVNREIAGVGTGEPDQLYRLANLPVLVETLELRVGGEQWTGVDDLISAGPERLIASEGRPSVGYGASGEQVVRAYLVDRESGVITFGDGIHGARPAPGALIEATYYYGGGTAGMVGSGAIAKSPSLPAGVKVANPLPTWGGDEPMSVDEAERYISAYLRHRDRCVSAEDFDQIATASPGVDIGRVEVLPLFLPALPDSAVPGVVTVMVIPKYDLAHPDTPTPDRFFLELVCRHLQPRRLVTTEVHVRGPEYVPVWASIGFEVVPGSDISLVRESVKSAIRSFLSALDGGHSGTGWPLNTNLERLELWARANRVDEVSRVSGVLLTDETGLDKERVELSGLQLPRLIAIAAERGDPIPLAELRGEGPVPQGPTLLPVPVEGDLC